MLHPAVAFLLAGCLLSVPAAAADQAASARRAIEAAYARLAAAVARKNIDAVRALYAPDYREVLINGEERGLAEVLAALPGEFALMQDPRLQFSLADLDAGAAEISVSAHAVQSFATAPTPSSTRPMRVEATSRDVWGLASGHWTLRRSHVLAVKVWADGTLVSEMTAEPPLSPQERADIVRDVRLRARPFDTVLAESGFADLAGLDALIGEARIVALGEASHGTAEFFQMKHRLLEYLVERKGFTVFAIEGNWPEAEAADRYIKTGEGDAAAALAAMYFWTWQTAEVRAMLEWMRAYNGRRGARPALSFTGFDMQTTTMAERRVVELLARVRAADGEAVQRLYDGIAKLRETTNTLAPTEVSAEDTARFRANAAEALALLDARREAILEVATKEELRDARQAARIVLQAVEMATSPDQGAERDRAMADNVRWLVEERFPGEKIVLWAHNGHVATSARGAGKSQGLHLRERYGDELLVLGFAFHDGAVRAKRMREGRIDAGPPVALPLVAAKPASVEGVLHEAGLPRFILDLRRLPAESALGAWLARPRLHRGEIGAVYDPDRPGDMYAQKLMPETYDALVYIGHSTAARPLN